MDGLQVRGRERNTKSQTPSSREIPESKHQKPSTKHQRNPKFQPPNRGPCLVFGTWSFSGVWCLVFGALIGALLFCRLSCGLLSKSREANSEGSGLLTP